MIITWCCGIFIAWNPEFWGVIREGFAEAVTSEIDLKDDRS